MSHQVPPIELWRISSLSAGSNCVQVKSANGMIVVGDSKNPDGHVLSYTRQEWAAFLEGAKRGEFDDFGQN
jgi:uncharacterized protein DUF397